MVDKPYQDESWLKSRWFSEKRVYEIANEADCSNRTIEIWAQKHGFPKKDDIKPYRSTEELKRLYHEERMSQSEIARHFDVSPATVSRWFNKEGIRRRTRSLAFAMQRYGSGYRTRKDGYVEVYSAYEGERYRPLVHRLLAVSEYGFDEVCEKEVHHANRIPWDNRPENIELLTEKEHGDLHGGHGGRPPDS